MPARRSLSARDEFLRAIGSRLIVRRGAVDEILDSLLTETGASALDFNLRRDGMGDDAATIARMRARVTVEAFDANYLHDPLHVRTASGGGFRVFTPFWNRLRRVHRPAAQLPAPKRALAAHHQLRRRAQ